MGPDSASPFSCFVSWTQTLTPLRPLPLGKQTTWFRAVLCSVSAKVCSSVAQGSTVALWILSLSSSPSALPEGGEI